jgi:hypothetical protein
MGTSVKANWFTTLLLIGCALGCGVGATATESAQDPGADQTVSRECVMDLESIPGFLSENDAGAKDELALLGQAHFDHAFTQARQVAAQAQDAATCRDALTQYLRAWRKGHLRVKDTPGADAQSGPAGTSGTAVSASLAPAIRLLSRKTLLLTIPSFESEYRVPLVSLIRQSREELLNHSNWIIDVRNNRGGSDSTYDPLLPWLMPDEMAEGVGEWLATPANIEAQEKACPAGDEDCRTQIADAIKRMRAAQAGTYVPQQAGPKYQYTRVEKLEPHRPMRVVVLMGESCASSCEQFLLTVRQSVNVKLLGHRSYGALDYANLRPHVLPSGKRVLWYAISRSSRLPDFPIDVAGVQPDIYLPAAAGEDAHKNELSQAQQWLEIGSLSPPADVVRPRQ